MKKTPDDYLKVIYPNIDVLTEERKQYEKDREFITDYFENFVAEYEKYSDRISMFGESEFTKIVLEMAKEHFDTETIIVNHVEGILDMLEENSYISNNFDTFMEYMYFQSEESMRCRNIEKDNTPIELDTVFELTEEFLSEIDSSGKMLKEFKKLKKQEKIKIIQSDGTRGSDYKYGIINYAFDGTFDSANSLIHEFMHHWTEINSEIDGGRETHTMLREFESIYYENAFIDFMDSKSLLNGTAERLKASRAQFAYSRDPNNFVLILLELCRDKKEKGFIDKESIIDVLAEYMPNSSGRSELWSKGAENLKAFCKEHFFTSEIVAGPIMYGFNNAMAMKTGLDLDMVRSVHKLIPKIKDTKHDHEFMSEYEKMTRKAKMLSVSDIGRRTIDAGDTKDRRSIATLFASWIGKIKSVGKDERDDR